MMTKTKAMITGFIIVATLTMVIPTYAISNAKAESLPLQTFQDENHIVITITKNGEPPQGPIVIIPPQPGSGNENGTIITPGENVTAENPGNVTVITPGGNVTEIPGNITNAGNDTIIIAPPDRNITETPGNVTVIDPPRPPVVNETPATPCTCNQTQPSIPPVTITPAPGQNVTTLPHPSENATIPIPPPQPLPPVSNNSGSNQTNPSGNETAGFPGAGAGAGQLPPNNQTGNTGSNETQTNPGTNSTQPEPPHPQQLPASYNIFPGFHITAVNYNYNGPNSEWLKK